MGTERRFERQVRFAPLGPGGQERLGRARVLVVGCGALGGALAQSLVRSGVGALVLVDRDVVEESNLSRQVLFDERHAREGATKVDAARETLARAGGPTRLETHATHLGPDNVDELAHGCDLVLDGTDNLATRYLLNDWCVQHDVPWVYGGVVASGGLVMPVLPHRGPCLRCVFEEPPPPGSLATCDTAGVLQPAVAAIAALQAGLALRILARDPGAEHAEHDELSDASGRERRPEPELEPALLSLDVWHGEVRRVRASRRADCPCCGAGEFPFLEELAAGSAIVMCGRNAVNVRGRRAAPDLDALGAALDGLASDVRRAGSFLRFAVDGHRITVFPDGRALVEGTEDKGRARALVDRYVGS